MTAIETAPTTWAIVLAGGALVEVVTDPPLATGAVWLQVTLPELEDPILVILDSTEARQVSAGLTLAACAAEIKRP